ncbi:MAG TPA: lysylphosphatidylglycerol synthase transmembrane domain-containing protein [Bacteroidales bacterium]|nr:lysylphosphatidylglycerol synthase transmembrane domain-containing protein [Bacteroidales bacterium]
MMDADLQKVLRFFQFKRIIIPLLLGLGVASVLLLKDFNKDAFLDIHWSVYTFLWLFIALILQAIRDIAYMYRLRILTDGQISWRHSFDVIMLWEFASSITPSIVGGSAIALFIVNREGISMGRTTAIVMITAMLDELFYIFMVPFVVLIIGIDELFVRNAGLLMNLGGIEAFLFGYLFILGLTLVITFAVFIGPKGFKRVLVGLASLPILRRWRRKAIITGNDIITTSQEMKGKPFVFWFKAFIATLFSWSARFLVVNALIMAFRSSSDQFLALGDQLLIYGRQLVMWVILLVSPTPGGSGVAEYAFPIFLGEFIPPGLETALGLLWRLLSYYPYLFIGFIVLPFWIRRVYRKKKSA